MRKLLLAMCVIAAISVCLVGCTGGGEEPKQVSLSAETPSLGGSAPEQAISKICEVSQLDAEQAAVCYDSLTRRLAEYGLDITKVDLAYQADSATQEVPTFIVVAKEYDKRFNVAFFDGTAIVNEIDSNGNIMDTNTQHHNGSVRETVEQTVPEDVRQLGDQHDSLHSSETVFNVRNSLNLELDDVASVVGKDVAERLYDDLNDNLALWNKSMNRKTDVQVSKDVEKNGANETFNVLAYVGADNAVFKVTYNTETLESTFELMP